MEDDTALTSWQTAVSTSPAGNGLLYLANILVQCALAGFTPGWHIHLRLDSKDATGPNVTCAPELTVYAAGSTVSA